MAKRNRRSRVASCGYQKLESRQLLTTFTVNTIIDSATPILDGKISLREAIIASNTNAAYGDAPAGDAGGDVIVFDSLDGMIKLTAGQFLITEDLTIDGAKSTSTFYGSAIDAAYQSRVFEISSGVSLSLKDILLSNGRSTHGATILVNDGHLSLDDVSVQDSSTSRGDGGAVHISGGSLSMNLGSFYDNRANGKGGAIYVEDGGFIHGVDSYFYDNSATQAGGAIANISSTIELVTTTLNDNKTSVTGSSGGGAIYMTGNAETSLAGSTGIERNAATRGSGGAIFSDSTGNLKLLDHTTASGNRAAKNGGGIHIDGGKLLAGNDQSSLTMYANQANRNGGSISLVNNATADLQNVEIGTSTAGRADTKKFGFGGGIYSFNSELTLSGNSGFDSYAYHAGGSIAVIGGSLIIDDTRMAQMSGKILDSATGAASGVKAGAAIYTRSAVVEIRNANFLNANGANESAQRGGGAFFSGSDVRISDSKFASRAISGGGIYSTNGTTLLIENTEFQGGYAIGGAGGGIFAAKGTQTDLRTVVFRNVFAANGGAIFNLGTMTIVDAYFSRSHAANSAIYSSGSLRISGSEFWNNYSSSGGTIGGPGFLSIKSSLFASNQTGSSGGAISSSSGLVILDDVRFTGNKAQTGGAISKTGGTLYGRRLVFGGTDPADGNEANEFGGAIRLSGGSQAFLSSASFLNNRATKLGGAIALVSPDGIAPKLMIREYSLLQGNFAGAADDADSPITNAAGGAIASLGGELDIRDTLFAENSTQGSGGALFNSYQGTATIRSTRILDNQAENKGGAVFNDADLSVYDSFVLGNDAEIGVGIFDAELGESMIVRTETD